MSPKGSTAPVENDRLIIFPALYCSTVGLRSTGLQVLYLPRDSKRDISDLLDREIVHKGSQSDIPLYAPQGTQEGHGISLSYSWEKETTTYRVKLTSSGLISYEGLIKPYD